MAEEQAKRKLAAILSADAKDYSRLMEDDEEATVRTITAYRELMVSQVQNQNGRVVDAKGDNLLVEFSSVVNAVRCAVEIQKELGKRNADLPDHRKMEFRIGVNLGDVIEEDETIYGDGVNIAARLEALAEGGGICISGTAFDQVEGKLGLEFEYLGEQAVKNIKKPVRVYRVRMASRVSDLGMSREFPLPDKPSIAVLPFVNMSRDPEQEYFSDGMSEDIITALSKIADMFVIARNSAFVYKGKSVNVQQVGRELGVRYVLEGSVRKVGDRVRITAQLIDATTGHHLWAERYDREMKEIFSLQDEITMKILIALQVKLTAGEQARAYAKGTDNLDAYLKFLQGRAHVVRMNKEANVLGRQMAEEAIALDQKYGEAYTLLATTHMVDVLLSLSKSPSESIAKAIELAQRALALDDSLAYAHGLLGWLFTLTRRYDRGIAECERAVSLEPNSAVAHWYLSMVLRFAGRHEEAITMCKEAIRLNPIAPSVYLGGLANAYCLTGQYDKAIEAGEKAVRFEHNNMVAHAWLAVAYSLGGREQESRREAAEVLRINPKFSIEYWANIAPFKNHADSELLIGALRKAGLR